MLRKMIYVLLASAIALNIGAGIFYNGVPYDLKRIIGDTDDEISDSLMVILPLSRSGDVYATSFNMTVEVEWSGDDGELVSGSLSQAGTLTRTIMEDASLWDMKGTQDMTYNSTETGELKLAGDISRSRQLSLDSGSGRISEVRRSVLRTWGFMGSTPQNSEVTVSIPETNASWEDILWRSLVPADRTFHKDSSGKFSGYISLDEVGVLLPTSSLEWSVAEILEDKDAMCARILMEGPAGEDFSISYNIIFSERSPYPGSIELAVSGSYITSGGTTHVDLVLSEKTVFFHAGSGSVVQWLFLKDDDGQETLPVGGLDGMVVADGSGESSFVSTPRECLQFAREESALIGGFIERFGEVNVTMFRSVYFRNETGLTGSRVWNVTLCGPETGEEVPALSFSVLTQTGGSSFMDRRKMTLLSENEHFLTTRPDPSRNLISLSDFEELLSTSKYSDRYMMSRQYAPGSVIDIVNRGNSGPSPFSTLLYNVLGMEREYGKDLFICHVLDPSDPMKIYISVIDGTRGRIVSETEATGLCALLFSSYGLDLA
ncbi:MAG: hypothetical protein JW939_09460 [Candidatus Thermoplasmatota archaeon]|nr:hypothetical protein [Candidatus Thermoplasmatota archaeon]